MPPEERQVKEGPREGGGVQGKVHEGIQVSFQLFFKKNSLSSFVVDFECITGYFAARKPRRTKLPLLDLDARAKNAFMVLTLFSIQIGIQRHAPLPLRWRPPLPGSSRRPTAKVLKEITEATDEERVEGGSKVRNSNASLIFF